MSLIGNYSVLNKSPCKWLAGNSTALASGVGVSTHAQTRSATNRPSDWRKFSLQDGSTPSVALVYAAKPQGYYPPGAWNLPTEAGGLSVHNLITGDGEITGNLAGGKNASALLDGLGTIVGTGQLVVSGSATITASGDLAGNVVAALAASAALSASGDLTGTSIATGYMSVVLSGTATLEGIRYAVGFMSANIAPATQLEAAEFSTYVLDQEDVETGLTVRNALRLIAAATAGELSGAAGTTITIRNAVADDKDRIVATVTSEGNRTAITYDLTDS